MAPNHAHRGGRGASVRQVIPLLLFPLIGYGHRLMRFM
jgi:hypothetical protein